MTADKELVTARALAEALDLSVETIWRYTRENRIPHVDVGGRQYRYDLTEVLNTLRASASTAREEAVEYQVKPTTGLTYQDYLALPDEPGYRFEVLEGELVREPSPNVPHQRASRRLQRILEDYFWNRDPTGEVFNAPLDVTLLEDTTVVQPDVFVVTGSQDYIIKDARVDGPPTLVVEVLSPSTTRKDRLRKLGIYQKAGIQHYWLVDPAEKTLECFSLRDGLYALVASGMDEDVVDHPEFTGLSINLGTLWHGFRHGNT